METKRGTETKSAGRPGEAPSGRDLREHDYVTARDLADYFGVSRATVQRWARDLGLPHIRIGELTLFRGAAVAAWLDAQERANPVQ